MTTRPVNSRVQHGDPACADYGCRREECLEARRRKQKRNKFLRQSGRPGFSTPERAAAHLAKFRAAGYQDAEIIAMTGLARNTFYRIMRGEPLTRGSEQKVLAVPVPQPVGQIRTVATVDATGTHRRLKALIWLGWPSRALAERLDVHPTWITRSFRKWSRVTLLVEARVRALYDECWDSSPEVHGVSAPAAEAARAYAREQGWHGPLAWDDDTIDDPRAVPQTDAVEPAATEGGNVAARWLMGESVVLDRVATREVLQYLFEWTTDTKEEIAARLEMTPEAAERQWHRLQEKARADGRRLWRRAWAYRDKNLTKNEMGAAA